MDIKAGKILVAEPFMLDSHFKRSVVLICEHETHGTTGFILNKILEFKPNELIPDFPDISALVGMGGPVAIDTLHYLHNVGDILDDSIKICSGLYWGGNFEQLKFLIENKLITKNNIRFFIGYSGWSDGQLEEELAEKSWIVDDMDANYLFRTKPFVLWQTVLHNRGDRFTVLAQMPDTISLN